MVMYLGNTFPCPSCDLPKGSSEAGHLIPFYLVLLRVGFTEPPKSPSTLVSSYLTVSPLPEETGSPGGLFSVALSLGSLPLDVIQHSTLWSSDFPRRP